MNADSRNQSTVLWLGLAVGVDAAAVTGWYVFNRRMESEVMCERLYRFVRSGQSVDDVQAALGEGRRIGSDEVPGYLAHLVATRWPVATLEEDDEFLFYETQHTKGASDRHYLQFRRGKLINFDERDYESHPEFYVLH